MASILSKPSESQISFAELAKRRASVHSSCILRLKQLDDEYKRRRADLQREMSQTLAALDKEFLTAQEAMDHEQS